MGVSSVSSLASSMAVPYFLYDTASDDDVDNNGYYSDNMLR